MLGHVHYARSILLAAALETVRAANALDQAVYGDRRPCLEDMGDEPAQDRSVFRIMEPGRVHLARRF